MAVALNQLVDGQEADLFVVLARKEESKTREGKIYFRVTFRDAGREITFPIWGDSPWAQGCRDDWRPGVFYKIRAIYRETSFGPQLEIRKLRDAVESDRTDGFDPLALLPRTRYDVLDLYTQLTTIAKERIVRPAISAMISEILADHRETLLDLPAAVHHHHATRGGFLEHVLSVVKNAIFLGEKYAELYAHIDPPLSVDLVIAGAILHDIGKLRELRTTSTGAEYTPHGELIGHIVLGRDIVREYGAKHELDAETQLRLEHIVISHQRTAEWGSPKPPMTMEALLVHYADDIDAKLQMMVDAFETDPREGFMTSRKNSLGYKLFRAIPGDST